MEKLTTTLGVHDRAILFGVATATDCGAAGSLAHARTRKEVNRLPQRPPRSHAWGLLSARSATLESRRGAAPTGGTSTYGMQNEKKWAVNAAELLWAVFDFRTESEATPLGGVWGAVKT